MTTQEHIQLLADLNEQLRNIYAGTISGGGELWDICPKAKRIREAMQALKNSQPTTIGELEKRDLI